jgi:hypothetical protein
LANKIVVPQLIDRAYRCLIAYCPVTRANFLFIEL